MKPFRCKRCGYEWTSRPKVSGAMPKECPSCKSYRWNLSERYKKRETQEGSASA